MSCLGIIGTAGRGPDGERLRAEPGYWRAMRAITQAVITVVAPQRLVSGGAAFSDHLCVLAYLEGQVPNLTLHLPAEWTGHGFRETGGQYDTGRTSNWYHSLFSRATRTDSLREIQMAIEKGAEVKTGAGGFKARNTDIANQADCLLAFTFGQGAVLRDGGTKDTFTKYLSRRGPINAESARLGDCISGPFPSLWLAHGALPAFHYDLTTRVLYRL